MEKQNNSPRRRTRGSAGKHVEPQVELRDQITADPGAKKVLKLEVRKEPGGRMYRIVYTGGGEVPAVLRGKFTTEAVALASLDLFRRSTFPEMYA